MNRPLLWLPFAVLGFASVGLMGLIDGTIYRMLVQVAPALAWVADFRLTSMACFIVLAVWLMERRGWRLPVLHRSQRWLWVITALWLVGTAVNVHVLDVWTFAPVSAADWVAFLLTGLLCEELLFRGVLVDVVERVRPTQPNARLGAAVWISSVLFGLSHLQFHGFALSGPALTQVAYTIPFGLILAALRRRTASIWAPVLVHLVNNVITVL